MIKVEINNKKYWVYEKSEISRLGSKYFAEWCIKTIPDSKIDSEGNLYLPHYTKYNKSTDALNEALNQYRVYLKSEKTKQESKKPVDITIGQLTNELYEFLNKYNLGFTKDIARKMLMKGLSQISGSDNNDYYYLDPMQRLFFY